MEKTQNQLPPVGCLTAQGRRLGLLLARLAGFVPSTAPDYMSNHYDPLASPLEAVTAADFPGTIEYWRQHHQPDEVFDPITDLPGERYCVIGRIPTGQWE